MLVTITNVSAPAEQIHIPSLGFKWLDSGDSVQVQRSFADLDGDSSLKQLIFDGKITLAFQTEDIDSVQVGYGRVPVALADATRGSAANYPVLSYIWNTDDNALNWSDGTNWRDAAGAIT